MRADDGSYKLFWGGWRVKEITSVNARFGADDGAEELIGTVFFYGKNEIKKNEEIIGTNPYYHYLIIPQNDYEYLPYMASPAELGITDDVIIYVHIIADDVVYSGSSFYIKNDNTLILYENNAFYELERLSYISDNVESYYVQP